MLKLENLRVNAQRLGASARERVVEGGEILISWSAVSDAGATRQSAYALWAACGETVLYRRDKTSGQKQRARLDASGFPAGQRVEVHIKIWDALGNESESACTHFYIGDIAWCAPWIAMPDAGEGAAIYFRGEFQIEKPLKWACLYVCGLGYQKVRLNGAALDDAALDPPHTGYHKQCQYVALPDMARRLRVGGNCLGVIVGDGWRQNEKVNLHPQKPDVAFFGPLQLSLMLLGEYCDGAPLKVYSDESWQAGRGEIVRNGIYDGETWDAGRRASGWDTCGFRGFAPAVLAGAPGGRMCPMTIPPVREIRALRPICVTRPAGCAYIYDFGENIAGVIRIRLPKLRKGERLRAVHFEILRPDGTPDTRTLRLARQEDTYIASGDEKDFDVWQPIFTYHGFRYAMIEGPYLEPERVEAVQLCTDMRSDSFFSCGSAIVNQIQRMILRTEADNQHSIFTDCPQRDERMGWMNDCAVRFEEASLNFHAAPMLRKAMRDVADTQRPDGAIGCTAPFVFGSYPADPVCSGALIAAEQIWMQDGDISAAKEGLRSFEAWEDCLLANSTGYIVNYSYYGDWAGPAYACVAGSIGAGAQSALTPGILMSTGYSYFNCKKIARFARALGRAEEAARYAQTARRIRGAMLQKWYDDERKAFGTDSMACLAFALWLGILPRPDRKPVADRLNDKLIAADYKFTTGNLATRYLLDALSDYGHEDTAWELMIREAYPSIGYMIQHEATTIWERFELKTDTEMNSHNHPMYASVGYWFYARLMGMEPETPGYGRARIRPVFPRKLRSAHAQLDTPMGKLYVRWIRRDGWLHLYAQVPFGMRATVFFDEKQSCVESGFHHWRKEESDE